MDRRAIEAELKRKKKELAKLQKQFLKAEGGRRSQQSRMTPQQTPLTDTAQLAALTATHSPPLTVRRNMATSFDADIIKTYMEPGKTFLQGISTTSQDTKTTSQDINAMKTTLQDMDSSQMTCASMQLNLSVEPKMKDRKCTVNSSDLTSLQVPWGLLNPVGYLEAPVGLCSHSCIDVPPEGPPNIPPEGPPDHLFTRANTDHLVVQPTSPHDIHTSPHDIHTSPHDIHTSPHDIHTSPHDIHTSPHDIHTSPHDIHTSPHDIHTSPHDIHTSPHDIHTSPHDIHTSPHDIHTSPHDMHTSPHDIHMSPHDIHTSPHDIHTSPHDIHTSPHDIHTGPHDIHTSPHDIHASTASGICGTQLMPSCVQPLPLSSRLVFPPLAAMTTTPLDFFLPDKEYQSMKLSKLTAVKGSTSKPAYLGAPPTPLPDVCKTTLSGVGTETCSNRVTWGCEGQSGPMSVEQVSASTEPTLPHTTQLDYCGCQNLCGLQPNCFTGSSEITCVWEHMFSDIMKVTFHMVCAFGFRTTEVGSFVGKKCLHDVAVANGVISAVHVEEEGDREKVCVHILPSGLSVMPASNWICASWMMEQRESVKSCFLLIQENTALCFVVGSQGGIAVGLRLYVVDRNQRYILNLEASNKSCSQAKLCSWLAGDQVIIVMALTGKELCHSIVSVWTLTKDKYRWQAADGVGTRLPLPQCMGTIVSLCEVQGKPHLLVGTTLTDAMLWDVRSHGLLVVATLCCCVARCELQPVVIAATSEEGSLFLLLGCKQGMPSSEELQSPYVAWLIAAPDATVSTEHVPKTHCVLVQSYKWNTRPWGYQWCEGAEWDFATKVSRNVVVLWNLLSANPYGMLSFGNGFDVGQDDTKIYWSTHRKQMIVVNGGYLYILSQEPQPQTQPHQD